MYVLTSEIRPVTCNRTALQIEKEKKTCQSVWWIFQLEIKNKQGLQAGIVRTDIALKLYA